VSGVVALVTIGVLTFFILLETPRMIRGVLDWMRPERSVRVRKMLGDVGQAAAGYMLGNLATSMIAGAVIFGRAVHGCPLRRSARDLGRHRRLPAACGRTARRRADRGRRSAALVARRIVTLAVFLIYQQVENHILNPVVMSRTVRLNPSGCCWRSW